MGKPDACPRAECPCPLSLGLEAHHQAVPCMGGGRWEKAPRAMCGLDLNLRGDSLRIPDPPIRMLLEEAESERDP